MSWNLDRKTLNQLKCTTCRNYISVPPVMHTPEGYTCGRCPTGNGNDVTSLYKIFAKKCTFPCRFEQNGCNAKIKFGRRVLNHERVCEYRLTSCPVDNDCRWTGAALKGFEHCVKKHINCVVDDDFKFEIYLHESNVNTKQIMRFHDGYFILHIQFEEEVGLFVSVKLYVEVEDVYEESYYKLILQSSDRTKTAATQNVEVKPCYCTNSPSEWIPYTVLTFLDTTKILLTIEIDEEAVQFAPLDQNKIKRLNGDEMVLGFLQQYFWGQT